MDGNQRYSWTKKKRSPLVSRTLPRLFRCNTISCCRSVAISASSRAFDLNGETKMPNEPEEPDHPISLRDSLSLSTG